MKSKLEEYRKKRDFNQTSEPSGEEEITSDKENQFVIQKHHASNLHYDFRLQIGDVMASWAVPRGPSTDPDVKRLAIRTEDHPISYSNFEGVIPEGNYGAGTVMIWDRGSYRNLRGQKEEDAKDMEGSLEDGMVEVWLEGEKLQGGYVLIRTSKGDNEKWLLKKMKDDEADARRNPVSTENESVQSGMTMEEIEKSGGDE